MSDDSVATCLDTDEDVLEFQRYLVERRWAAAARQVAFRGAAAAQPAPGVVDAIRSSDTVPIAPSNPYLRVDPLLAIASMRAALIKTAASVVAVSPTIGGRAVKGPTAKLMAELGFRSPTILLPRIIATLSTVC